MSLLSFKWCVPAGTLKVIFLPPLTILLRPSLKESFVEASKFYNALVTEFPDDPLAPQALYASAFCLASAKVDDEAARDWRRLAYEYPKHELVEDALYRTRLMELRERETRKPS